ncbi:MAG: ankyrin repeat domain-containing protein [Cytophagales bacterium]|nr:ankyrin repeat domain-containing protein [Cytophagales bacterium]
MLKSYLSIALVATLTVVGCAKRTTPPLSFGLQKDLIEYSKEGDILKVKEMIRKGAKVDSTDDNGATPLHWAAFNGHLEVVRLLIDKGADKEAKHIGQTSLHWAVIRNHLEVVRLLIDKGANIEAKYEGWTPLHWAAANNRLKAVILLIDKGANIDAQNERLWTPLHLAVINGHQEVVNLLVEKGANVNLQDNNGRTPKDHARNNITWPPQS